jgi:isoleucyl-tRNA synthetase
MTLAAPILAFTAEDIWQHLPRRAGDPDSVHLATYPEVRPTGEADAALVADFSVLIAWRDRVTKALEPFRAAKHKSVDARVTLRPPEADRAVLARYEGELADLFIVSAVELGAAGAGPDLIHVVEHAGPRCERCWKHFDKLAAEPSDVCERCAAALAGRA